MSDDGLVLTYRLETAIQLLKSMEVASDGMKALRALLGPHSEEAVLQGRKALAAWDKIWSHKVTERK